MTKVQITYFGKQALVDEDQVALLRKKESLTKLSVTLNDQSNNCSGVAREMLREQLHKNSGKIIRLNRKIRQNVQFVV